MAGTYDSSTAAAHLPVTAAEAAELAQAGSRTPLRDPVNLAHFVGRVVGTLAQQEQALAGMHRELEEVRLSMSRMGRATTLNPLDALKYIDDEQRDALFTATARKQMAMLRTLTADAERAHVQLTGTLHTVRAAVLGVAHRPDLPTEVRAEFARLAAALPQDPPPVPHPGMLDYPDPEPDPVTAPAAPPVPDEEADLASLWDDPDPALPQPAPPAPADPAQDRSPGTEPAEPVADPAPVPPAEEIGPARPRLGEAITVEEFARRAGLALPEPGTDPVPQPAEPEPGPAPEPPRRRRLTGLFGG